MNPTNPSSVDATPEQVARHSVPSAIGPDGFRGDTANLRASIKALVEMDMDGVLVPHGIGGHARALLTAAYHRLSPESAFKTCQSHELRHLAELTKCGKPLRCALGFHRFGAFQRLLLTSRHACTRCGAVYISTGFDGMVLGPMQSRAELIDAAQAIEARRAETQGGSVHESAVRQDAPETRQDHP